MTEKKNGFDNVDYEALAKTQQGEGTVKATWKRWIILSIFIIYAATNSFQWVEYTIISNIVVKYYNVSSTAVTWTSMIYMALYAPLVLPISYVIDKKGLRVAGLVGCLGTCIGTSIKVFSVQQDLFWLVLVGQTIVAASQSAILCLTPLVAAVWFRENEASTASALGVFGTQLGSALGFIIPSVIVQDSDNMDFIGSRLKIMCWSLAGVMIPTMLAVLFYFPKAPKHPPNVSQLQDRKSRSDNKYNMNMFITSIKDLFKNGPFMLHVIAYGINIAVFSAVASLLNVIIMPYFNDAEEIGRMGLVMVITGMLGSIVFGIYLDKYQKYKETTVFIYFMTAVSLVGFIYSLEYHSLLMTYITLGAVGLFTNAYMSVGFELAMELTHPSPESTTTGILLALSQILGVLFTLLLAELLPMFDTFWALSSQVIFICIGTCITAFVPNIKRRQDAFNEKKVPLEK